ncbi:MAG: hypothetical protein HXX19_01185 [Rhodoferax sp.]|nr:hypothetical protein [Rhodoferax sp.]
MADTTPELEEQDPLSGFAPRLAHMFVSLAGDIALVVDRAGVIQNVAVRDATTGPSAGTWVGQHWAETVTGDTRRKIELLLQEVDASGVTRRREVNHPSSGGSDIPMSYSALRLGKQGPVIAVGRDLRTVAAIQQQMIHAQQDMERDYWTLRRDQSRQRELDQVATDAVLVVDAATLAVLLANDAAQALFATATAPLPKPLHDVLLMAAQTGRAAELRTRLKSGSVDSPLLDLFVTPLQPRNQAPADLRLMVRARRVGFHEAPAPDTAVVVTDIRGRILMGNDALLTHCPVSATAPSLYGQPLAQLLDSAQSVLETLLTRVLSDGLAHAPSAILGGHGAPACEATITATLIMDGDQERIGFSLLPRIATSSSALAETLLALIAQSDGQPLERLLQQVTELTEHHAISNALQRSGGNLAASAALLGLDAQDLTLRLQRHGLDCAAFTTH